MNAFIEIDANVQEGTVRNFLPASSEGSHEKHTPAVRLQTAMRSLPKPGEDFLGFHLIRELGRGSFGRVYLATQPELAGRMVALKVSVDLAGESRSLAQLQHTNIVPVYSVHRDGYLHAVCMPFFGGTTLADLMNRYRDRPSVPATGRDLVNTLRDMVNDTRPDSIWDSVRTQPQAHNSAGQWADVRTDAVFTALSGMSYTEAIAWIIARVADGLAHAHDRGILHRDVKPANILMTDDGQPMLLDFGVAEDLKHRTDTTSGRVGGTIPYMAPEHLEEIRSDSRLVDHRSDLYSLGVILFELLTGKHPFRIPTGNLQTELPVLIDERRAWVPDVREFNPNVPEDLASIVKCCVASNPNERYQSAAALRDDLDRHLRNEWLLVAPELSVRARFRKWRKRNPRFGVQVLVASGVICGLGLSVGAIVGWKRLEAQRAEQAQREEQQAIELARHTAEKELAAFQEELRYGQYLLSGGLHGPTSAAEGMTRLRAAVDRYSVTNADWKQGPAFASLPEAQRKELSRSLSDACLFLARGHMQQGKDDRTRLTIAARFNALAETLRDGSTPRAVLSQRGELYHRLNEKADAEEYLRKAEHTPLTTAEDYRLAADEWLGKGKMADAIPLYRKAVRLDPQDFWAHFNLGVAYHRHGQLADARSYYSTALALRPDFVWTYFNRALTCLMLSAHEEAVSDLDRVIEMNPDYASAYLHRAQALAGLGNTKSARFDLDAVLAMKDPGGLHGRAYLQRAELNQKAGDREAAKADTEAGLRETPVDETGWLLRALARMGTDLPGALADIEKAVERSPDSVAARQNQAYVLDQLGRNQDCLEVMNRLIELAPKHLQFRAGKAVLLARLEQYESAFRMVDELLTSSSEPRMRYMAACVYSLASRKDPKHRAEAIRLLTTARGGFRANDLKTDPDIDPIRDDPEVQKLIEPGEKTETSPGSK
jgi:serine/threonine protein kinase/Flp pilus assembly protein TadD